MKYFWGKVTKCYAARQIVLTAVLLFCAVTTVIFCLFSGQGVRHLFIFENFQDNKLYFEVRYLPLEAPHDISADIALYVRELALGPLTPGLRPLFAPGTGVETCFVRDGRAWIDLGAEALLPAGGSSATMEACSIFRKNVFTNFRDIDSIGLYILNEEVYRDISMPAL